MNTFTVWGFLSEGEKFLDFSVDIFADSPWEAIEKMLKRHSNLVVSSVSRSKAGKLLDY
jgi:hypothetical protein